MFTAIRKEGEAEERNSQGYELGAKERKEGGAVTFHVEKGDRKR